MAWISGILVNGRFNRGGGGGGGGALQYQYSSNGTSWHSTRLAADIFDRVSTDGSNWSEPRLLDTVANIEEVTTPLARYKLGYDNQGRLYGNYHRFQAGTDAVFESWTAVPHTSTFIGAYYGEPYRHWTIGERYYDSRSHIFKECFDIVEDFGNIQIPLFRDEPVTDVFGANAIWVGERSSQQGSSKPDTEFQRFQRLLRFHRWSCSGVEQHWLCSSSFAGR